MRYHTYKPDFYTTMYGEIYECDHEIYNECTLFRIKDKGIAVIQQRFNRDKKYTWWGSIDEWLTDIIYLHPKFMTYFKNRADRCDDNGLYPTVTIRQIMWSLNIKPIPKYSWETTFDRKNI